MNMFKLSLCLVAMAGKSSAGISKKELFLPADHFFRLIESEGLSQGDICKEESAHLDVKYCGEPGGMCFQQDRPFFMSPRYSNEPVKKCFYASGAGEAAVSLFKQTVKELHQSMNKAGMKQDSNGNFMFSLTANKGS